MKFFTYSVALALIGFLASNCTEQESTYSKDTSLNTLIDSTSYVIGYQTGSRLAQQGFPDLEMSEFVAGVVSGLDGDESKIADSELQVLFTRFNEYIMDKMKMENQAEAEEFFAANREKEGVVETASGLQYKVLTPGDGESPTPENTVVLMYEGRLIDGTIFDSSYDSGEPTELLLGRFIPGFIEGVQQMQVGATYELYVPADLAYGDNPRPGGAIQPGDALIFKVELLEIK